MNRGDCKLLDRHDTKGQEVHSKESEQLCLVELILKLNCYEAAYMQKFLRNKKMSKGT